MIDFAKHLAKCEHEPQWLKEKRASAWEKFSALPMPSEAEEGWRLLDPSAINLDKLENVPCFAGKSGDIKELERNLSEGIELRSNDCLHWYQQINEFIKETAGIIIETPAGIWCQLDQQLTKNGVIFTTLAQAVTKHADVIQPYLVQSEDDQEGKFSLLNQALHSTGMVIFIPEGIVVNRPLVYLNSFSHSDSSLTNARLLLLLGKHAQLQVINVLTSGEEGPVTGNNKQLSVINHLLQAHLQAGARLDYAEVQNFDSKTFAVIHSDYQLERDSSLNALIVAFGAGQLKGEIRTVLKDRGAESKLNGVVLGNKSECFNFNTIDDHDAPDTKSSIDFRVALKDEAQSMYQGIIKVAKTAQKTEAFQSNKNLLLSEKTHADSIPKLEILADDVKCSHGATVGPVDRNQVFYLMSRGLSANKAEELIVSGFFHQLLADCKIDGVSDWLDSLAASKISDDAHNSKTHKNQPALSDIKVTKEEIVGARFAPPASRRRLTTQEEIVGADCIRPLKKRKDTCLNI